MVDGISENRQTSHPVGGVSEGGPIGRVGLEEGRPEMRRILVPLALMVSFASTVLAEETPAQSRIVSIGLFKNGLAVVKRSVIIPDAGVYRVSDVPEPVHGTFWIESDAVVETRVTTQEVEVPLRPPVGKHLQEHLAGREVLIHFRDSEIRPVSGKVVEVEPARGEEAWGRTYEPRSYYGSPSRRPSESGFLILATEKGLTYVDPSMIAYAEVEGATGTVKHRMPVLLLAVKEVKQDPSTIVLTYLAKGMAWAPSYRVDISDPETLAIMQKAVIKNELADVEDAEMYLISGFPSVQFVNVTSPLSLRTNWANFFQQLRQRPQRSADVLSNVATQQVMAYTSPGGVSGLDISAVPTGEGPDLHYQSIGRRTLAEGDSLALQVASGTAPYERIVEWLVPDTRRADGRFVTESDRRQDPQRYEDAAWDAVCFNNPLAFPMTTGPAIVVAKGRFKGQRTIYWANAGEEVTLHITKALSIRTRSVEHEVAGEREIVGRGGRRFQKTTVKGELSVSNHRNESVKLVIRRRFSGDLLSADGEPTCVLREEGVYSVNKRNELVWTLSLEPGAGKTLTYRYSVLVYY